MKDNYPEDYPKAGSDSEGRSLGLHNEAFTEPLTGPERPLDFGTHLGSSESNPNTAETSSASALPQIVSLDDLRRGGDTTNRGGKQ